MALKNYGLFERDATHRVVGIEAGRFGKLEHGSFKRGTQLEEVQYHHRWWGVTVGGGWGF